MVNRLYSAKVNEENINKLKFCMFCGCETTVLHLTFKRIQLVECKRCDKSMVFHEVDEIEENQRNKEAGELYEIIKRTYYELRHPDPEFSTYKACSILKGAIPEKTRIELSKKGFK